MTPDKRRISLTEVVIAVLAAVVLVSVLSPVIAINGQTSALAQCQANLRKLGGAFRMYLADWDRVYPTNKAANAAAPVREVQLPPWPPLSGYLDNRSGRPAKFAIIGGVQQISWVGALYDYVGPITSPSNRSNVWKCPAASSTQNGATPSILSSAAVTYVINFNLLEQPESESRHDARLMLLRETDRLVASFCRAGKNNGAISMTYVRDQASGPPTAAFLTMSDVAMTGLGGPLNPKPHGAGSNILFTDGHVKCFDSSTFTSTCVWDSSRKRWVNAGAPMGIIDVTR